jgi:hypothetical protein
LGNEVVQLAGDPRALFRTAGQHHPDDGDHREDPRGA